MAHAIQRSSLLSGPLFALLALVIGAMTVRMPQVAVAGTLLMLLIAVRLSSRTAGLSLLWTYWLLTPFLRRVIDVLGEPVSADPLSLLPFLGTALLAVMELRENRLSRRGRAVLASALGAFALGIPVGLTVDPAATMFAALAYSAGLSAFVIGWGDRARLGTASTMERTLRVLLVPLSLYAIAQYFYPLSSWDSQWVAGSELNSLKAPQEGHIRVFSTLNSPFTFAITVAVGLILGAAMRRGFARTALYMLPLIVALALTFVRTAWLALVVGLIVYAAAGRGRTAGRTVGVILICLAGLVVVGGSNPTTKAFTERITSLGDPESDRSTNDRLRTTSRLLPQSLSQPLGAGLGQAGLATGLSESDESGVKEVDNGYLAIIYQSGLLALLFLLFAIFISLRAAIRVSGRSPPAERPFWAAVLAVLVMLLVAEASADVLFGLPGVVFWYFCGISVAAEAGAHVLQTDGATPINSTTDRVPEMTGAAAKVAPAAG